MKQFNVIIEDINSKKFIPYDVVPYLVDCYRHTKIKPETFTEFKEFITKQSRYQWWARYEYEIVLQSWPAGHNEKKIDVYWQIMMNIDLITEILMKEIDGTKS